MKLHPQKVAERARQTQGKLAAIEANSSELARINDYIDDGRRGTAYDTVKRGGNDATGPERAAMSPPDQVGRNAQDFVAALDQAFFYAARARKLFDSLVTIHEMSDATSNDQGRQYGPGEGNCLNCNGYVPGIAADRLRSGRCEPCYRYRLAHEGIERPKTLWEPNVQDVAV